MDKMPSDWEIKLLAQENPILHHALSYWFRHEVSWEQALMLAVVQLDATIDALMKENIDLIEGRREGTGN